MTNKEAVKILKDNSTYWGEHDADKFCEAYDMAIKALGQEPILDKIIAEIEQVRLIMDDEIKNHDRKDLINFVNGLNQSLMIIDKHKAEKE